MQLKTIVRGGAVAAALALVGAAPAGAAWQSLGELAISSPATRSFDAPQILTIDGKLHVAWAEWDGTPEDTTDSPTPARASEVRVARLDADGWHELGCGASPINRTPSTLVRDIDLADRNGQPLVSWVERDEDGRMQARVSAYDAVSGRWAELVGGPRPINNAPSPTWPGAHLFSARRTRLAVADGRPSILTRETHPAGSSMYLRTLSADGTAWEQSIGGLYSSPTSYDMVGIGSALWAFSTATYGGQAFLDDSVTPSADPPRWAFVGEGAAAIAADGGKPYVLTAAGRVHVFDPSTNTPTLLGGGPSGANAALAVAGGRPFVAGRSDGDLIVRQLKTDASGYETATVLEAGGGDRVSVTTLGGRPYAAWVGEGSGGQPAIRVAGDVPTARPVPSLTPAAACPTTPPPGDGETPEPPKGDGGEPTPEQPQGGGQTPTPTPVATAPTPAPAKTTVASTSRPVVKAAGPAFRLLTKSLKPGKGGKSVRLRIACLKVGGCEGTVVLRTAKGQKLSIARGSARIARGKSGTVTLKLTGEGRRLLRRGGTSFRLVLVG